MLELQRMKDEGILPLRVTHNDTKANNLLFDHNDHPLCVIDLDTVMPGIVHYDFGDAIRSSCNTAGEETRNLDEVHFNMDYFEAFTAGFMEKAKHLFTLKKKDPCTRMHADDLPTSRPFFDGLFGRRSLLPDHLSRA